MTIEIYSISGAPRPWRVSLGACFKNLPFTQHVLQASEGEHKSEPFLTLNPRGTVPVLVDGGIIIRDSIGALAWLDKAYPANPIFGNTSEENAHIWQTVTECADYLRAAQHNVISHVFSGKITHPSSELKFAAETLMHEISSLDTMLSQNPFLCGKTPSAADAIAFPELRIIKRACDTRPDLMNELGFGPSFETSANIPTRVSEWVSRIEGLPNIQATFPSHW